MEHDSELQLLSNVHEALSLNSGASQRDLAEYTNLSLGMTNALLRRFADKGWLYMKKISKRNIQYVLTPQGLKELGIRSKRYFKNTARLMNEYQSSVRCFIKEASETGFSRVILVGSSDLEFLFDYACRYYRMSLIKIDNEDFDKGENYVTSDALVVFSDEMQYEAGKQHESDYIRADHCTSVMDIIRHSEKSFA